MEVFGIKTTTEHGSQGCGVYDLEGLRDAMALHLALTLPTMAFVKYDTTEFYPVGVVEPSVKLADVIAAFWTTDAAKVDNRRGQGGLHLD